MNASGPESGKARVLVVGIGNELLRDEGLGIHVARSLAAARERLPAGVEVVEAGLSLLDCAPEMALADRVVLVDAVRASGVPGTLYRLELDRELTGELPVEPALSLHQWGVEDTLRAIALMGLLPPRLTVLGAEPEVIEPGMELSPVAEGAVRRLVDALLSELGSHADEAPAGGRAPP